MCRSKADGGRLCPCQSSARRSAKYKARKAAVALGDNPPVGARSVSDAPSGVFPEGMPARESFEKLRAGWDADAARNIIATVNSLTDEELEGAAGDAIITAYPDMMSVMLSDESMRGLDGVTRRDAVRAAVAVEVGCALAAEADKDEAIPRARERFNAASNVEEKLSGELKEVRAEGDQINQSYEEARERKDWDAARPLYDELHDVRSRLMGARDRWLTSLREKSDALKAVRRARQESYTRLLAQVRDMGGGLDAKTAFAPRSSVAGKKIVQSASRLYPTSWNKAFSDPENNQVKVVLAKKSVAIGAALSEYGFYQHKSMMYSDGAIGARLRVVENADRYVTEERICHEMMHRMERTVPGLLGAEQAFLRYRADGGNYGVLYGDGAGKKMPVGYVDSFPRAYAGRVYNTDTPFAFEVMSVGVEHVFYGNTGDLSGEGDREGASPSADREYRGFVLGVLASL